MSNIFLSSVQDSTPSQNDSLNDINDLTRIAYTNQNNNIPLKNNSIEERFDSEVYLSHKESFETNNSRINNLNEEIRELKNKLKEVYEKDKEIYKLQCEVKQFSSQVKDIEPLHNEIIRLKDENKELRDNLDRKQIEYMKINSIETENNLLRKKLLELNDLDNSDEIKSLDNKNLEETIQIDVPKLKEVLYNRLKIYHEKHIDELIHSYELKNKSEINKSTMEKLLIEAIHI